MVKNSRELEKERRARRKAEDKALKRYLKKIGVPTKIENLNDWDRWNLLDRLNEI